MHTPTTCRHILVPGIIQRREHMSYMCWCLQLGSSAKHAKARGWACLVNITKEGVLERWSMPAIWSQGHQLRHTSKPGIDMHSIAGGWGPHWCSVNLCSHRLMYFFLRKGLGTSLVAQTVKNLPAMQETWVQSLSSEDPLEEGIATHSRILAWRILWTEEPGGSMRSQSQTRWSD